MEIITINVKLTMSDILYKEFLETLEKYGRVAIFYHGGVIEVEKLGGDTK